MRAIPAGSPSSSRYEPSAKACVATTDGNEHLLANHLSNSGMHIRDITDEGIARKQKEEEGRKP